MRDAVVVFERPPSGIVRVPLVAVHVVVAALEVEGLAELLAVGRDCTAGSEDDLELEVLGVVDAITRVDISFDSVVAKLGSARTG